MASKSSNVEVEDLGHFHYSKEKGRQEEKTTDVRLAVKLVEDALTSAHKLVLLISADGDFVPALQRAKRLGKVVKVAFPPDLRCEALEQVDRFPYRISPEDLERNLIDGEGTTEQLGEKISTKAYQWMALPCKRPDR